MEELEQMKHPPTLNEIKWGRKVVAVRSCKLGELVLDAENMTTLEEDASGETLITHMHLFPARDENDRLDFATFENGVLTLVFKDGRSEFYNNELQHSATIDDKSPYYEDEFFDVDADE